MYDHFRFPFAVIYAYRKYGFRAALDMAMRSAKVPVTENDARNWINYLLRSPAYKGYSDG